MDNIWFLDGLDALRAGALFVENSSLPAIIKNVSLALVISNSRGKTLPYKVGVTCHVKSISGVYHYMIKWLWESDNITNTFWITEESCKNKFVTTLIFKYKKLNKL
jgi:hypothetical protein